MGNCKANHILYRSNHERRSVRKDTLRNFAKFTVKNHVRVLFLRPANLLTRNYGTGFFL